MTIDFYWFLHAIAFWSLAFFLVPISLVKRILPFAFIGGFLYTFIVQYVAVDLLEIWAYRADIATVLGIPVFFILSWFAVTLLFGFFLYQYPRHQLWTLTFFVFITTLINILAAGNRKILFIQWGLLETFLFAVFSHILLLYLFKYMYQIEELGAKDNMVEFSFAVLRRGKKD